MGKLAVFIETTEDQIKPSSLELLSAGQNSGQEVYALVLDGRTGTVLASAPSGHSTHTESTAIADVDSDGRADVLVPMAKFFGVNSNCGVVAYSNPTWWGAPGVWLDIDYHRNDTLDGYTVPAEEPLPWCDHNTVRVQEALAPRLVC